MKLPLPPLPTALQPKPKRPGEDEKAKPLDQVQGGQDFAPNFYLGQLSQLEAKGDIFENRHMRPQRIVLKYEPDFAGIRRHQHASLNGGLQLIGNGNHARVGNFEAGDGSQ